MSQQASYLDVRVGPYALALRAELVRGVHQDVSAASAPAPLCDLAALFGAAARPSVPFAVLVEAGGELLALGVDRVGHLSGVRGRAAPVPALGLSAPDLFEGAVRHASGMLLVLAPLAVARLALRRPPII